MAITRIERADVMKLHSIVLPSNERLVLTRSGIRGYGTDLMTVLFHPDDNEAFEEFYVAEGTAIELLKPIPESEQVPDGPTHDPIYSKEIWDRHHFLGGLLGLTFERREARAIVAVMAYAEKLVAIGSVTSLQENR